MGGLFPGARVRDSPDTQPDGDCYDAAGMPRIAAEVSARGEAGTRLIRVLVVDDSRPMLASVHELLVSDGRFQVVGEAREGWEALGMVETCHPDLVLMDVRLPGLNGFETTIQIKSRPAAPAVVIMTSHSGPAYRKAAESAGADGFLDKWSLAGKLPALLFAVCRREEP